MAIMDLPQAKMFAGQAGGDPAAFAPIYDQYFSRVHNYFRYRVRHADIADDLTARTFERALEKIDTFDPRRSEFGTWLFTIARNAATDHLRAGRRRRWVSLAWLAGRSSPAPGPERVLLESERRQRLLAAVGQLADREQDLLGLKFAAGRTNREIAGLAGLSESNVGVILYRSIRKLRLALGEEERSDD